MRPPPKPRPIGTCGPPPRGTPPLTRRPKPRLRRVRPGQLMRQELLSGLLDDASLFPPASLKMPAAIAGHQRHAAAWYSDLCGPFVCAQARLAELSRALTVASTVAIELSLVVSAQPGAVAADAVAAALDAVAAEPRFRLRAVEVPAVTGTD